MPHNTAPIVTLRHIEHTTSCGQDHVSRNKRDRWEGGRTSSCLHAQPSEDVPGDTSHDRQTSEYRPVLLADIEEDKKGAAQFVVALLHDRKSVVRPSAGFRTAAWWTVLVSFLAWQRHSTYGLSDSFQIVSGWDLEAWWHLVPTAVATHRTINLRRHTAQRHDTSPRGGSHAAPRMGPSFHFFLQLPSELRDMIYSYTLLDEHQMTNQSRIYARALLFQESCRKDGLHPRYYPRVLTIETLPRLHTPCILSVSRQIRQEALSNLSRTKTFVISVTPATGFPDFSVTRLPHASLFMHIRLELILGDLSAGTMVEILRRAADFLFQCARRLRYLEVRIGYQRSTASAAIVDHSSALVMTPEDILRGMRELGRFVSTCEGRNQEHGALQVRWGVNEAQRRLHDYNCGWIYLSADCLNHLWSGVFDGRLTKMEVGPMIVKEDCRTLGCRFHQY